MNDQELIKAVAEKVMGWHLNEDCEYWVANPVKSTTTRMPSTIPHVETYLYSGFKAPGAAPFGEGQFWNPITDANHWMMVVDKLISMDYGVELYGNPQRNQKYQGKYVTKIFSKSSSPDLLESYDGFSGWQDSIGRAICLATLKAVEGE